MKIDKRYRQALILGIILYSLISLLTLFAIALNPQIFILWLILTDLTVLNSIYIRMYQKEKECLKTTIMWVNEYCLINM